MGTDAFLYTAVFAEVYDRYRYIREKADINEVQARLFDHVVQGQATEDELALSLELI